MKLVFALFLTTLALFSAGVNAGTCTLPASYLEGLDYKNVSKSCSRVGNGKNVGRCDKCFAAFISAQTPEVIKYIDLMAALTDPTGTFVQTAKDCASSVTKVVKSKMTAKQRKKAKYLTRCFSVDPSKLKKTTEAVAQFGSSILG